MVVLAHSGFGVGPRKMQGMPEGAMFMANLVTLGADDDFDLGILISTKSDFQLWLVDCYGSQNRTELIYNQTGAEEDGSQA